MNEHDPFEQRLRRQPLRPVPTAWREEILNQARRVGELEKRQRAAALQNAGVPTEGWCAGWRLPFARLPLAWASLAALWMALIGVNLMLPSPMVCMAEPSSASAELESLLAWEVQPVEFGPLSEPPTPASQALPATKGQEVPVRPRSERRRGAEVGETQPDPAFDLIV